MRSAIRFVACLLLVAVSSLACDFDLPVTPAPTGPPAVEGAQVRMTAMNITFDQPGYVAPAEVPFLIVLANKDEGIPHSVQLSMPNVEPAIAESEVQAGIAEILLDVPALPPGVYRLMCVVHPNMEATLTVQ